MLTVFTNIFLVAGIAFRLWLKFSQHADQTMRNIWKWLVHPMMWVVGTYSLQTDLGVGAVWFGLFFWGVAVFAANHFGSASGGDDSHRRGQVLLQAKDIKKWTRKEECRATLGEIDIPRKFEPLHFLISGTTGAGKTLAFHQLMQPARRTDAAIVADVGGTFVSKYYREGDVILNPTDERCPPWSPLAEMVGAWDGDRLANSFIPDGEGNSREWNHYAKTLFSAVFSHVFEAGGTNADLYRLLVLATKEELAAVCAGTEAAKMFNEGTPGMLASSLAIAATYAKPLRDLHPDAGEDGFSIRKLIKSDKKTWVFLTARDDQLAYLKPLIAAQIDIAASALLVLPESRERRVWFFLDEFATFGRINSIEPLLSKGRKYGGAVVIGLQSISQFFTAYPQHVAKTLLACLGTWLVLRAPDPETSEFMSKYIGETEVLRTQRSGNKEGESWSHQVARERVVLPSEIANLPDRTGIINLAGEVPAAWSNIPITNLPNIAKPFCIKAKG